MNTTTTTLQDQAAMSAALASKGGADLAEMVAEGIGREITTRSNANATTAKGLRWDANAQAPTRVLRWDSSSVDLYEAAQAERSAARARNKKRGSLFAKIASLGMVAQLGVGAATASTVAVAATDTGREMVASIVEAATPLEFAFNNASEAQESVTATTDAPAMVETASKAVETVETAETVRDEAKAEIADAKQDVKVAVEAAREDVKELKASDTATKDEIATAKDEVKEVREAAKADVAAVKDEVKTEAADARAELKTEAMVARDGLKAAKGEAKANADVKVAKNKGNGNGLVG